VGEGFERRIMSKSGIICYVCDAQNLEEWTCVDRGDGVEITVCDGCSPEVIRKHPKAKLHRHIFAPVKMNTPTVQHATLFKATGLVNVKCSNCGEDNLKEFTIPEMAPNLTLCENCFKTFLEGKLSVKVLNTSPQPHTFKSGATSSEKLPSYHLLPFEDFAPRLAARYQLGLDKGYGLDNWRTGLTDDEFVVDRLNHGIQHMHRAAEKISRGDYSLEGDDDLAGAMWACVTAMAAQKVRNTK
jgi:protein-arginine kinase activator protein McsA